MSILYAAILGVIQGLTEFLPISSSGHLVLGGVLLGLKEPHLLFDVVVHTATLVAIVVYYRRALFDMAREVLRAIWAFQRGEREATLRPEVRFFLLVIVGTIPTGCIGVLFKDQLEDLFGAPRIAAAMLLVTAGMLVATRFAPLGKRDVSRLGVWHALAIGLVQGIAIIPGISRSGSTIAVALFLGVERELAARFSFLLALPAVAGALVLKLMDGSQDVVSPVALSVGFAASAVVGLGALAVLIPMVRNGRLHYFALYLVPAGVAGLLLVP